jgi:PKD repeat protein
MRFNEVVCIFILTCIAVAATGQVVLWPISSVDDPQYYTRVNCTFGEIHPTNGDHFHGAIDIDINTSDCPARAVANGRVDFIGSISVRIEHESYSGSGVYNRRTRYLHVDSEVSAGDLVDGYDIVAEIDNNSSGAGDHLHFEMWELVGGNWQKINPLRNSSQWQLNSPLDNSAPEINDIYVIPVTQPNGVASGFSILSSPSGAITTDGARAKIHFNNRPGSTGSTFSSASDVLVVYGNLVNVVSARDVGINGGGSDGLTVQDLEYQIDGSNKYRVNFDRFYETEQFQVENIFHTAYNTGDGRLYGNNDFIEMYTLEGDNYTTLDTRIGGINSNGVWHTKALQGTSLVHTTTPVEAAAFPGQAKFGDGPHVLRFVANDASGQSGNADLTVVVDNFKPYIKEVKITKGSERQVYRHHWEWDLATSQLILQSDQGDDAGPADALFVKVVTSEPIANLSYRLQALGQAYSPLECVANSDNKEFVVTLAPVTGGSVHYIDLQGTDFAGNQLQSNPALIPVRLTNGSWGANNSPGPDVNRYYFNAGTYVCTNQNPGGRTYSNSNSPCSYVDFVADKMYALVSESVVYDPIVSGTGVVTYSWTFGSGAVPAVSSSSGPQTVLYTTPGPKTVTLKICDATTDCITETKTNVVTVGPAGSSLVVDFTASPSATNIDQNVTLTSQVTGAIGSVSYQWTFDGAATGNSTVQNPVVTYATPGNKSISLTVTDDFGSVTKTRNNLIYITSPSMNISVSITGCVTTGADKTVSSLGAFVSGGNGPPYDSYLWDFGDGTTSTTSSWSGVSHTYSKPGKYTVRLTVKDETYSSAEAVDCVIVPSTAQTNPANAAYLINNIGFGQFYSPVQVGYNTPVTFVDATTGYLGASPTYSWIFDDHLLSGGTGNYATPQTANTKGPHEVYYSQQGKKEVRLTVNGSQEDLMDVVEVVKGLGSGRCFATIGDPSISTTCWQSSALPTFTIPIIDQNCPIVRKEVLYFHEGSQIIVPNNILNFEAMNIPVPQFPIAADFAFIAYQDDGISHNPIAYKKKRFTIYGPVTANAGADKDVCLGATVTLGGPANPNHTYQWTATTSGALSQLSSISAPNSQFAATQKGTFTYRLQATDVRSGCTSPLDEIVVSVDNPTVTARSFAPALGQPTPISADISGGSGPYTYSWSPTNYLTAPNVASPSFSSTSEGNHSYMLTVSDSKGCLGAGQVFVNVSDAAGAVTGTATTLSRIHITWVDRSNNEIGFLIRRSSGNDQNYVDYVTVGPNVTSYDDTNITPGSVYYYNVITLFSTSNKAGVPFAVDTGLVPKFTAVSLGNELLAGVFGDFDFDFDLDIYSASVYPPSYGKIYKNNQGTFQAMNTTPLRDPIVIDSDNDGDLDIIGVSGASPYNYNLIVNNFTSYSQVVLGTNASSDVAQFQPIDYDLDNDVDLVEAPGLLTFQRNGGNNSFTEITIPTATAYNAYYSQGDMIEAFDFDNTGSHDIVTMTGHNSIYSTTTFPNSNNSFPDLLKSLYTTCCIVGEIESGDINSDGHTDLIVTGVGTYSNGETHIFKNLGSSFDDINGGTVSPRGEGALVKLGDMDADGDLDLMLLGAPGWGSSTRLNQVYVNNNGAFTLYFSEVGTSGSAYSNWFDFDNDGDLDIVTWDHRLLVNNLGTNIFKPNTRPKAPRNLCVQDTGDQLIMSWGQASDDETPSAALTYNLYVKQNGVFVMTPFSDLNTGNRKVARRGNVDHNRSWTVNIPDGNGQIEWGVQAVDTQLIGSEFAVYSGGYFFEEQVAMQWPNIVCGTVSNNLTHLGNVIQAPSCSSGTSAVTVLNSASLALTANTSITLKPGFHAVYGSRFSASIRNGGGLSPCSAPPGGRVASPIVEEEPREMEGDVFRIFPNPTHDRVTVQALLGRPGKAVVELIDFRGRVLRRKDFDSVSDLDEVLDLGDLASGMYILRVTSELGPKAWKIIKL